MFIMKLNESTIPYNAPEEQLFKTNLIILYDHGQQNDVFIIKNPSKDEIDKIISVKTGCYTDDNSNPLDYDLEKYGFFVNTENLVEINYDDEELALQDYFYSFKDFFIECYKCLTFDFSEPGNKLHYDVCSDKSPYEAHQHALKDFLNNKESAMWQYYVFNERWEDPNSKQGQEKLQKIRTSLKSFETFVKTMRDLYLNSVCDCDSGWSSNFVDLKEEKKLLGSKTTNFHFIETLDEYYVQMADIIENEKKEYREKHPEKFKETDECANNDIKII